MARLKEFVPDSLKAYISLVRSKLHYRDCFIGSPLVGRGAALGRGCSISRGVEVNGRVSIGAFSYVNCGALILSGTIGRYCSIGPYSVVGAPEHPTDYLSTSPMLYGPHNLFGQESQWVDYSAPPEIGCDVWIGAFAFVRQGLRIGHGAIVAAGAVVTRDVAAYEIVGGVPARHIRYRFDPRTIESLLGSRWWEHEPKQLAPWAPWFRKPMACVTDAGGDLPSRMQGAAS
jgi:acetyltransferase-like isoleucine patch superfamily enzyme